MSRRVVQIDRFSTPQNYVDFLFRNLMDKEKSPMIFEMCKSDANRVYDCLEADLSPENLHEDGEASAKRVKEKMAAYKKVVEALKNSGHAPPKYVKFNGFRYALPEVSDMHNRLP